MYEVERAAKDVNEQKSALGGFRRPFGTDCTYNFPERRVTDHRINLTLHQLDKMLDRDLDEVVDALLMDDQARQLSELA